MQRADGKGLEDHGFIVRPAEAGVREADGSEQKRADR